MLTLSYREAANLLGKSFSTISVATKRGVLVELPTSKQRAHFLSKEQVELFRGKKLSLLELNSDERAKWEKLTKQIKSVPRTGEPEPEPVQKREPIYMDANQFVRALVSNGVVSTGNSVTFPSARADKEVSNEQHSLEDESPEEDKGFFFLVAVLLGLLILIYVMASRKPEVTREAEEVLEKIGLTEDTLVNQSEAIETLRTHPRELKQLQRILEKENLLAVA